MDFENKVVLINGATGGIGAAIARRLAREHCKIAIVGRREDELEALTREIQQQHGTCLYKKCDVKKKQDIEDTVTFIKEQFGRIDVAILTAGILVPNPIETFDTAIIKETMDVNFFGMLYFIEYVIKVMKKQKSGTIAAVSTLPDKRGVPGWGAYGASKAALSWFMESLRAEAKLKYNINMITIKPGSVQTPMIKGLPRRGAISPEKAAEIIVSGIKKEKKVIQFPFLQVLVNRLIEQFPSTTYDHIPIELQKGEGYPIVEEK
jgi:short-subunit dehydrogenase